MWLANFFRTITQNGGFWKSCLVLTRTDALKLGSFKGKDPLGNRYYENPSYFLGTNRWVIYSDRYGYDYDASHIHCTWFRWMHYMTECPPEEITEKKYPWLLPHEGNKTGSSQCYVPYSTVLSKIKPWKPPRPIKH